MSRMGKGVRAASLCLVVMGATTAVFSLDAAAQQAPSQPEQQPGTGAQVHTGTSNGITVETRIRSLMTDHEYFQVADELDQLPPEQAQLYRGVLANKSNDAKKSIDLLEPLIDKVTATGNTADEKMLRKSLAEDYLREGDWAKAGKAYAMLQARLHDELSEDEKAEIEMPLKMAPLAAANPQMTVDPCEPFLMQVSKNPLGLIDIPVFVDAQPHSWMLDPTAPFNLIARSLAREVGLKVSDDAVTIHALTGKPMQVHVTVIPRFTIAGRLTLHNMTAFVFEDADYAFPRYRVQGVLGYPALQALGSVKITADDTIEVHPSKEPDPPAAVAPKDAAPLIAMKKAPDPIGARFFLDGEQIVVALGSPGNERMFAIDAGGQQSYLSSRYYAEHTAAFAGQPTVKFTVPNDSSIPPQQAYVAETVPMDVGGTQVNAHFINVLTQPLGSAALDDVYGMLGVDVLDQLHSYTFDYRTMRFGVSPE
ncbi:MAG TPA: retropepsin-like aspartic protease [Terracidiphilus sp.]